MEGDDGQAKLAAAADWRESPAFSEPERLALEYAEKITITGERVEDALFDRLKMQLPRRRLSN